MVSYNFHVILVVMLIILGNFMVVMVKIEA